MKFMNFKNIKEYMDSDAAERWKGQKQIIAIPWRWHSRKLGDTKGNLGA